MIWSHRSGVFPHDPTSSLAGEAGRKPKVRKDAKLKRIGRKGYKLMYGRTRKAGGGVKFCAHMKAKAKVYPPGIVLGAKAACCLWLWL